MGKKGQDPHGGGLSTNKKKKLRLEGLIKLQAPTKKKVAALASAAEILEEEARLLPSMHNVEGEDARLERCTIGDNKGDEIPTAIARNKGKQVMIMTSDTADGCLGMDVEPGMGVGTRHALNGPLECHQPEETSVLMSQNNAHQVFDGLPSPGAASGNSLRSITLGDEDSFSVQSLAPSHAQPLPSTPWANLFKDNRDPSKGLKLKRYEGPKHTPEGLVELHYEDVDEVETAWGICLIGFVVGKFPGVKAIEEVCKSWKTPYKYFLHASGWIVFKFEKEEHRDMVLVNGPYTSFGRPWLLKRLPPFFDFNKRSFSSIPTWITLPDLPLECWNDRALPIIVSAVGDPVATDRLTAEKQRLSYARVLVEVDFTKPLMREIPIKLPNGTLRNQPVRYERELKWCSKCGIFGHTLEGCRADEFEQRQGTIRRTWVRKDNREFLGKDAGKDLGAAQPPGGESDRSMHTSQEGRTDNELGAVTPVVREASVALGPASEQVDAVQYTVAQPGQTFAATEQGHAQLVLEECLMTARTEQICAMAPGPSNTKEDSTFIADLDSEGHGPKVGTGMMRKSSKKEKYKKGGGKKGVTPRQ